MAGHSSGVGRLIEAGVLKADGEGVDRSVVQLRHVVGNGAGVDAPAQEEAQGHVGDQPQADRLPQEVIEAGQDLLLVFLAGKAGWDVPVAAYGDVAVAMEGQAVAGGQLMNPLEDGSWRRHVLVGEVLVQGVKVDLSPDVGVGQQRLQLRGEDEAAGRDGVVEGLLAHPVPGQEQLLPAPVPDGEGEHAVQGLQAAFPLVLI